MRLGDPEILVVAPAGRHTVAPLIQEAELEKTGEERLEAKGERVLTVVGALGDVAVAVGVVERDLHVEPVEEQVVALAVVDEDAARLAARVAVVDEQEVGLAEVGERAEVVADEE